jgi:hypothetical protein
VLSAAVHRVPGLTGLRGSAALRGQHLGARRYQHLGRTSRYFAYASGTLSPNALPLTSEGIPACTRMREHLWEKKPKIAKEGLVLDTEMEAIRNVS